MTVWFVRGLPDDNMMKAWLDKEGKVKFSTGGSINMHWKVAHHYKLYVVKTPIPKQPPSLIVNELSSPETHADALKSCLRICNHFKRPVINHPAKILQTTRDKVAKNLAGIANLIVPPTFVCNPKSPDEVLEFAEKHQLGDSVIIRETGTHGGETMVRFNGRADYALLHQLAYDGRDFYMSSFVDYQSSDGLYRKLRIVNIGNEIRPRHCLITDKWMVHAAAREFMDNHPKVNEEETHYMQNFEQETRPKLEPIFAEMRRRLGLDYFGADCHLYPDGRVLLFEANANMNVTENTGVDKGVAEPYIARIVGDFRGLIDRRLKGKR
ncbi:MAG: hypothetical protein O3A63_14615 [Proteobacteria bacterium]|nr:hypothetical protein [Pseudomonadota bacterium]